MRTSTAEVIDLQSYRADREARLRHRTEGGAEGAGTIMAPIAWIPVWVMPVYFVGGQAAAAAR